MWHPPEEVDGLVGDSVEAPVRAMVAVKVSVIGTETLVQDPPKTRL